MVWVITVTVSLTMVVAALLIFVVFPQKEQIKKDPAYNEPMRAFDRQQNQGMTLWLLACPNAQARERDGLNRKPCETRAG
jgi:hypothetical protein